MLLEPDGPNLKHSAEAVEQQPRRCHGGTLSAPCHRRRHRTAPPACAGQNKRDKRGDVGAASLSANRCTFKSGVNSSLYLARINPCCCRDVRLFQVVCTWSMRVARRAAHAIRRAGQQRRTLWCWKCVHHCFISIYNP